MVEITGSDRGRSRVIAVTARLITFKVRFKAARCFKTILRWEYFYMCL
jgi:hypothetical protein